MPRPVPSRVEEGGESGRQMPKSCLPSSTIMNKRDGAEFYLRPSTDASTTSLVDPLSFLLFPDAPHASPPIPRSTLPSSMSSSESPPMVSDYTVQPPVT
jgi:hypothetical protein